MTISKVSTLTSGILAVANNSLIDEKETLQLELVNSGNNNVENILVIGHNYNNSENYDELIESIYNMGFRVVISNSFTSLFSAKAIHYGILTIEVSRGFLNKIINAGNELSAKLFIDIEGREVMIINTGEKEYFEINADHKERFEKGRDDVDNLYAVWDDIDYKFKHDDLLEYAIQ
ncbi:MAG TPA: hypothetical protein P5132_09335 [Bacteroidales bacterium]|nr:hypothetical protein [Bacteroidales bacterium]